MDRSEVIRIKGREWQEALAARFGDDLQELVRQLGIKIDSAEEITRLISARQRKASFKLTLTDGRLFKARRFKTPDHFSSVVALSPLIEDLHFSRIVAAHGMASIEQWIGGSPLSAKAVTEGQAHWAGSLLGQLHKITDLPQDLLARAPDVNWYSSKINTHLAALVARGALEPALAEKIFELALECQPASFDVGLTHGDFCADNMVIRDNGEIFVVDNESLGLGALDYDIARCLTRWPMNEALRKAFLEGYQRHRSLQVFASHQEFWAIKALSLTVYVHFNHNRSCEPSLAALEQIADGAGDRSWLDL